MTLLSALCTTYKLQTVLIQLLKLTASRHRPTDIALYRATIAVHPINITDQGYQNPDSSFKK